MKVRDGVGKWLLKKAVAGSVHPPRDRLPQEAGLRRACQRVVPRASSATGRSARSESPRSPSAGCSTTTAIDELWAAHRSGRAEWAFQLWNLYNVSAWHDHWVAGRALA